MNQPLTGKVALVTGGSRGLGAATVRLLAEQGADVGFTYISSEKQAQAVVDEVRGTGANVAAFRSDQADTSGAPALIDEVVAYLGGLDILVNNAAVDSFGPIADLKIDEIDAVLTINVRSVVIAIREALAHLGDGGRIINIGSINATARRSPANRSTP